MLVEKKSLRRFLLVYILSSLFLLSIGTSLYYKTNYQLILTNKITQMKKNIDLFITTNQKSRFLKTGAIPNYLDFPISIYVDMKYLNGTFELEKKDLDKEYFQKNEKFYYIHKEHKKWGQVYFITFLNIHEEIKELLLTLFIFFTLATLFIIIIAYILGKIFLKPMRNSIEALEEFITDATHEINTPISNILTNIELAKELYPTCKEIDEFQKIENSAFRISQIFKDLSFVKLEHKKLNHLENLEIQILLLQRLEFFHTFIQNKNLNIDTQIEPCQIVMDKEDLIRLVDNLLSNAIKYTKPHKKITIELTKEYLYIMNDGEIHNEKVVMKKFVRDNKNEGGFGLGLYIVEKICDSYGFTFTISSLNSQVNAKILF